MSASAHRAGSVVRSDPEDIALWLAILHTARTARRMADEERPPTIDSLDLVIDGYPVADDFIIANEPVNGMFGATVVGRVRAINCSTVTVRVSGPSREEAFHFEAPIDAGSAEEGRARTHEFRFTATEPCLVEVTGVNPFGEAVEHPMVSRPLRILTAPCPTTLVYPDIDIPTLDDEAIRHLSDTWSQYREYGIEFDATELGRELLTITDQTQRAISDAASIDRQWAQRLNVALAAYPALRTTALQAMAGMPTAAQDLHLPAEYHRLRVPTIPRVITEPYRPHLEGNRRE